MVQVSRRSPRTGSTAPAAASGVSGSALVGLLTRLTDSRIPESGQSISERLSQWLGWTDAISLSSVLGTANKKQSSASRVAFNAEEAEVARVRDALIKTLADEGGGLRTASDFSPYRRRYVSRQQTMESAIAPLRTRLQAALVARSPALAQLAAVDAVMAQALGSHEVRVLSTIPVLLEKHYTRLRRSQADQIDPDVSPDMWLDGFTDDMQSVLFAELDIRLQPIEGLLEALRSN
ncbi:DUF3348 domain-containing protein [Variovorax sp. RHLX14]|uniref:DUF3348 domain-containing protein n=1 Tax=Variovorax sp. RHLX14 TaxID=1259731 RepID=UPI003F45A249